MRTSLCTLLSLSLVSTFSATAAFAAAEPYAVDAGHSSVGFEVKHMFSKVKGRFTEFEGKFKYDEAKPETSDVTFKIATKSISTDNAKRDDHLKSPDFFDAGKNADITFKSKKVVGAGKGKFKITGDMTMHGVTKEVTFEAEHLGSGKDPYGRQVASFSATSQINRKDFGIVWNKALDGGGFVLGDDVKLELQIESAKEEAKK